ncbi:ankyrin repeat-containing protein [Trifolium pratense]|uniref:Ankyrin repeat-containing protein n=1 Tax=Trifolium pratense TaxID=57577 RepID=A0A2K3NBU4_TRIPR|nr:ankyrin repeat-containing protein [Trifolium pratense]
MNTHIGSRLKAAAQAGNINDLYKVIQDDPSILEDIDLMPFIETPLHIAASLGHLQFATEIMRLKPSFAWKLNPQGFSPIHLAMHNDQKMMVYRFVSLNKDLVRVQGREGITPLHFASQIGEVDLITTFLILCQESIEYLTVRRETALHIALKNGQYEALQVLVGWLKRGSIKLENDIVNQIDEAGNTILHIAALSSEPQALKLLIKTSINLNEKNLDNKTSLDIATSSEMKSILFSVGAKSSSEVVAAPTVARLLMRPNILSKWLIRPNGEKITEEEKHNTWLIVVTLIATAMYGSIMTPPGGVYQISVGDGNNLNITSSNSTLSTFGFPGSSWEWDGKLAGVLVNSFVFHVIYAFFAMDNPGKCRILSSLLANFNVPNWKRSVKNLRMQ